MLRLFVLGFCLLLLGACTPKTSQKTTSPPKPTENPTPPPADNTNNCATFEDAPFQEDALDNYALYQDNLRNNNLKQALVFWKQVYEVAPAADGQRNTIYLDGAYIYGSLAKAESNLSVKKQYYQSAMKLYKEAAICYPKDSRLYDGLKAFDLYFSYSDFSSPLESYALFKKLIDEKQLETPVFVYNPFSALLVDLTLANEVPVSEAQLYAKLILEAIPHNKKEKSDKKWKEEGWDIVEGYAPNRLEGLEGIEEFFDPTYFRDKYYPQYLANPTDCETIKGVYGQMRWGKCGDDMPEIKTLRKALTEKGCVKIAASEPSTARKAYTALQEGQYSQAVTLFDQAAAETTDSEKKARYYFLVSKIYYAHLKRFSSARSYALKAAQYKSKWGEPYILIGKLYASSGPLCGSGRGWNSQVVTWPAIDKWEYAKSIDSSVASEANTLINRYQQYMPSVEDIFQRTLKEGDSFRVGCWIQETTRIRAAR